jgi:hypothetical protein
MQSMSRLITVIDVLIPSEDMDLLRDLPLLGISPRNTNNRIKADTLSGEENCLRS